MDEHVAVDVDQEIITADILEKLIIYNNATTMCGLDDDDGDDDNDEGGSDDGGYDEDEETAKTIKISRELEQLHNHHLKWQHKIFTDFQHYMHSPYTIVYTTNKTLHLPMYIFCGTERKLIKYYFQTTQLRYPLHTIKMLFEFSFYAFTELGVKCDLHLYYF